MRSDFRVDGLSTHAGIDVPRTHRPVFVNDGCGPSHRRTSPLPVAVVKAAATERGRRSGIERNRCRKQGIRSRSGAGQGCVPVPGSPPRSGSPRTWQRRRSRCGASVQPVPRPPDPPAPLRQRARPNQAGQRLVATPRRTYRPATSAAPGSAAAPAETWHRIAPEPRPSSPQTPEEARPRKHEAHPRVPKTAASTPPSHSPTTAAAALMFTVSSPLQPVTPARTATLSWSRRTSRNHPLVPVHHVVQPRGLEHWFGRTHERLAIDQATR